MKQWDMQHIGIFDINFETGERYWPDELRRILRVPEDMPADLSVLLQHVHPDEAPNETTPSAKTIAAAKLIRLFINLLPLPRLASGCCRSQCQSDLVAAPTQIDPVATPALEKLRESVRRFLGTLFQNPMPGVWQHNDRDIVRDQLHLRGKLVA